MAATAAIIWLLSGARGSEADLAEEAAGAHGTTEESMQADAAPLAGRAPKPGDEAPDASPDTSAPPEAAAGEDEREASSDDRSFTFRDVHDGSIVDGLSLISIELASDPFEGPANLIVHEDRTQDWSLVTEPTQATSQVLWVTRVVEAHIQITAPSGSRIKPAEVTLSPSLIDTKRAAAAYQPDGSPPHARLGHYVLRPTWEILSRPESLPGVFVVRVPRLPEVLLRASAPGYRQSFDFVPIEADPERTPLVNLHLVRGPRISGAVTDDTGKPVTEAHAQLLIRRPAPRERADLEKWMYGASAGCWVFGTTQDPYFVFTEDLKLDAQGRFATNIPIDGEIGIKVKSAAHHPLEHMFGELRGDTVLKPIRLTAVKRERRLRVVVTFDGNGGGELHQVKITIKRDRTESFFPKETLSLDREGRLAANELQPGKRYSVFVPGLEALLAKRAEKGGGKWLPLGTLEWDGEQDFALLNLHRDPR